jgi:hypothetical protein
VLKVTPPHTGLSQPCQHRWLRCGHASHPDDQRFLEPAWLLTLPVLTLGLVVIRPAVTSWFSRQ